MPEPTTPPEDNSTIREMRERIDALTQQVKEYEALPTQLQAKETELNNLREALTTAQNQLSQATASPDLERLNAYENKLAELYEQEILSAPQEKQEALRKISSHGDMLSRINLVKDAKSLISADVNPINPVNPQTPVGVPPTPTATPTQQPTPIGPMQLPGWGDVLKPVNG